jgi:hypothetical protein
MTTNPLVILQASGPLPVTASFTPPTDSPSMLMVSGTVWTTSANGFNGVNVAVNGVQIGTVGLFINPTDTHMAMPATLLPIDLSSATPNSPMTITLSAATSTTTSDVNDFYQVSLFY